MSKSRVIAGAAVFVALMGMTVFSYVERPGSRSAPPDNGTALVGDAGSPPATGMLSTDEFIEFWRQRVTVNPADYISYAELAGGFLRRAREIGDVDSYNRAEAAINAALAVNPNYESAINYQASVSFARHDFAGALETAQRVQLLNPGSAQAVALIGDANIELGNYAEAESGYGRLLAISHSAPVYSRLARLSELKGDPQEAIRQMTQAVVEVDKDAGTAESRAWYHLQLGHLYFNTGDPDSAQSQYQASLDAFPGYVHALAGLGRVHAARGDYDEAIALYTQVTGRQPVPEYVAALGDVYRASGRVAEAQNQYDLIAAIDQLYKANGINTDLAMALFFADHDLRLDDAVAQARAAYQRQPGNIHAADVLAWTLYKTGQYQEALTYSQQARRLGTRDALVFFHAGMIERKLGDDTAARDLLDQAVSINPRFSVLYADLATQSVSELRALATN